MISFNFGKMSESTKCVKWVAHYTTIFFKKNKTRTSKVGAISKAQKAQNIFFGKKLEIFEICFRKMSHSAEKL